MSQQWKVRIAFAAAVIWCAASMTGAAMQRPTPATDLKIVVIKGEGAINVIQRRTAVAPVVEVRDRNNLPVPGATVTFTIGGSGASFGGGVPVVTVTTNALGQATAAGLTPTASGAFQINVAAAFQGQSATAAIAQTNFATAAQAAAASGGGSTSGGAAAAGGAGGGGISATTIGIVGAAVAGGGALVATQTDLLGKGSAFVTIRGQVFTTIRFGGTCNVPAGGNGNEIPLDCYGPPVGGATVSTTLDNVTATTDGAGNFDLTTTVLEKDAQCNPYTLTISAAGQPTYAIGVRGFATSNSSHRQRFALSPPTPGGMNGGC